MLTESDLGRWLGSVEAGKPASVFANDVEDVRNTLEQLVTSERKPARVVALTWFEVPPLGNELDLLVNALARAGLALYPSLYGTTQEPDSDGSDLGIEADVHTITRRVPDVLGPACRQILFACRRGQVPRVRDMSNSEQVRQLALAIEPHRLVVLISVLSPTVPSAGLRALAQGTEWLASNTRGRVILILPTALRNAKELDHVTYTACAFPGIAGVPARHQAASKPLPAKGAGTRSNAEQPKIFVSPVVGSPHAGSDAEQELYRRMIADQELRPLFAYNQPITTVYDTRPTVDLVWEGGRLVIEIDGADHRGEQKFAQDRKRDFELLMSGYRVARFTSSSVIEQTDAVVNQIRRAVRYLQSREKK